MNGRHSQLRSEDIISSLADLEGRQEAGTLQSIGDATVTQLKNELEAFLVQLRQPLSPDPFETEPGCRTATELVQALVREGSDGTLDPTANANTGIQGAELPLRHLGQYELLSKLGEGGMGAVYKARHLKLDKIVALKVLPPERTKDKSAVARFAREMRAVGKLDHPNIVRAMDAGEVDGTHFLVMEYVQGIDLSQLVRARGPLPVAEACELIRQAALGLDEAHELGMVHRDIKPSNQMLCTAGKRKPPVVKILDLGLALLSEAHAADAQGLTGTGQMMGTLDYMAPEQGGDSHVVDIRADIYSLGASLYKLLTGEAIYHGPQYQSNMQKLMALATQPAPPIQSRRAGIPDQLAASMHRMLDKSPSGRYATPKEVADALAPFCAGADLAALLSDANLAASTARDASLSVTDPLSSSDVRTDPPFEVPSLQCGTSLRDVNRFAERGATISRKPPRWLPLAIGGGGLAALLAGIILYWQTPHGTVRIEINDENITAQVDAKGVEIKKGDDKPIRLEPGDHGLRIKHGDLEFQTNKFVLAKGGAVALKIELLAGEVQVTRNGERLGISPVDDNTGFRVARTLELKEGDGRTVGPAAVEGFVPLFNQQDLSGWTAKRSATIEWRNENGTITGRNRAAHPNSAGQLVSQKQYKDFHFRCEVLAGSGVEPVIMFRNDDSLVKGKRRGYALTDPRPSSPVIAQGWGYGSLYADDFQVPPHQSRLASSIHKDLGIETGDWYLLEFIARGVTVEVRINGKQTAVYTSAAPALNKAGTITLRCGAGANLAFRNLQIKDLTATDSAPLSPASADHDRRAAEWVLSVAGTVRVNGQELDINAVESLPKEKFVLTMVRLVRNQLSDEGLAHLRHCKSLMVLDLAGSLVTDEHLAYFQGCKNLTFLRLQFAPVTDAGLAHFEDCKGLVNLDLTSTEVTDAGLVHFKDCKKLTVLCLDDARVTDAGLAHFQGCRDLFSLGLQGTRVTGTGLAYGKDWTKLSHLNLAGTEVTDTGLALLKDCKNLTNLTLDGSTKVTDTGLAHIGQLSRLWWLELNQTGLTDEGMSHLAQLKNLALVNLTGTKVTDAGLAHFKELKNLEGITLWDTQIGDASIDIIAGWTKLTHVRLQGTKVTAVGVNRLAEMLPKCRIEWDGGQIEPKKSPPT